MSDFGAESVLVPDLAEPITAYRGWAWDGENLVGFGDVVWPKGGPLLAECHANLMESYYHTLEMRSLRLRASMYRSSTNDVYVHPDPPVPCIETPCAEVGYHGGHGCGIYAYDSLEEFAAHGNFAPTFVWGQVELGGKVFEHAHGWRAQYGQVVAIYNVPASPAARAAAEAYGVPLLDLPLTQAEMDELRTPTLKPTKAVHPVMLALDDIQAETDQVSAAMIKAEAANDFVKNVAFTVLGALIVIGAILLTGRLFPFTLPFSLGGGVMVGIYGFRAVHDRG